MAEDELGFLEADPETHRRRMKRREGGGEPRYLTFSCFRMRPMLRSARACGWFVDAMQRARSLHAIDLWAWVVMPEHVHMLVVPRSKDAAVGPFLLAVKQSVSRRAVAWVRANSPSFLEKMSDVSPTGRVVHRFWQRGGGYDRNLWKPESIWKAIEYIHQNPVKRGLVEKARDWEWSSAREFEKPGSGPVPIDFESLRGPRTREE